MSQENSNRLYSISIILAIALMILAAGLFAIVLGGLAGQRSPVSEQKALFVSGSASELVVPDTASLSIGAVTRAGTAKEAADKNAAIMNDVIRSLKGMGLQDREIKTSIISIQPVYSPKEDLSEITGYSASNNVQITTRMLENLSAIIDGSVASGANEIGGISFSVSEEKQKQIHEKLLAQAVEDANAKAKRLAENLKVKILGVRTSSISESGFFQPLSAGFAEKTATPIMPGETQMTLSVQMNYIID